MHERAEERTEERTGACGRKRAARQAVVKRGGSVRGAGAAVDGTATVTYCTPYIRRG